MPSGQPFEISVDLPTDREPGQHSDQRKGTQYGKDVGQPPRRRSRSAARAGAKFGNRSVCADRERPEASEARRSCGEAGPGPWQLIEPGEMLDDRNVGAEEDRMCRPPAAAITADVVDIHRVDSDQGGATIGEMAAPASVRYGASCA